MFNVKVSEAEHVTCEGIVEFITGFKYLTLKFQNLNMLNVKA